MKNLGEMMKQVQQMQTRMQDMQAKLAAMTVEGRSGGGLVTVTLNGKGALTATRIDESLLKPSEKEIIEDLFIAAHADAKGKLEQLVADQMKEITGGIPLPPGMQFPF